MELLHGDPVLKQAGVLAKDGGLATIKFHALDISQEQSIRDLRDVLKREHPDGIDAVVNNAGGYSSCEPCHVHSETSR